MAGDRDYVTCAIAGCGPAGAMLGLLLARAGVDVLVLEKHADFFRDFRGDTVHPSTLDVLSELGLFERFSQLRHERVNELSVVTDGGPITVADFRHLRARHPYIAMVPQWDLLDLLTSEARRYPSFRLEMEAEALALIRSGDGVDGLTYRHPDGERQVRAQLTVAADGRHSAIRSSSGLEAVEYGAPMDVLWFRLPRRDDDTDRSGGRVASGHIVVTINRGDYWQVGYVIPKGSGRELRAGGIETLRSSMAELFPALAERVDSIEGWDDVSELEVRVNRLRRWHLPGLLCIGDAAHAMSPVAGVGINLAVQDAVAAANVLAEPLLAGTLTERDLARVQRRRVVPVALTQALQRLVQRRLLAPVLRGRRGPRPPKVVRELTQSRAVGWLPARLVGLGLRPEHVRSPLADRFG